MSKMSVCIQKERDNNKSDKFNEDMLSHAKTTEGIASQDQDINLFNAVFGEFCSCCVPCMLYALCVISL